MYRLLFTFTLLALLGHGCARGPAPAAPAAEPVLANTASPAPTMLVGPTGSQPAPAEGDEEGARRLFQSASEAYQRGEYQVAADHFTRAYELAPLPVLLFNIAQAYRQLGDCDRANFYLQRFVDEADESARQAAANVPPCSPAAGP